MYFVEDNAADVHDNQVALKGAPSVTGMTSLKVASAVFGFIFCLCIFGAEPSRGDGGAFLLLDVRGDQGGAQALVAAARQRRGDFPHQRPDAVARLRQHQGEAEGFKFGTPVALFSDGNAVS